MELEFVRAFNSDKTMDENVKAIIVNANPSHVTASSRGEVSRTNWDKKKEQYHILNSIKYSPYYIKMLTMDSRFSVALQMHGNWSSSCQ